MIFNWRAPVDSKSVISACDKDEAVSIPHALKLIIMLYEVPYVRRSLCIFMGQLVRIFAYEIWKNKVYKKLPENLQSVVARIVERKTLPEMEET